MFKRIWEHRSKLIEGFTARYNVTKLIYFDSFTNPDDAISAEKRIKGWTRKKKIDLIREVNPDWEDLFEKIDPSLRSG